MVGVSTSRMTPCTLSFQMRLRVTNLATPCASRSTRSFFPIEAIVLFASFKIDLLVIRHPAELTERPARDNPAWPVEPLVTKGEPVDPIAFDDDEAALAIGKIDSLIRPNVLQFAV